MCSALSWVGWYSLQCLGFFKGNVQKQTIIWSAFSKLKKEFRIIKENMIIIGHLFMTKLFKTVIITISVSTTTFYFHFPIAMLFKLTNPAPALFTWLQRQIVWASQHSSTLTQESSMGTSLIPLQY